MKKTNYSQPLDVGINSPFKNELKKSWADWFKSSVPVYTNAVFPCIPMQCSRVYQSSVPVYTKAVFPCMQCSRVYQCSVPVYTNAVFPCIPMQCSRVYQCSVPVYTKAVFPCIPMQCSRVYQCCVPVYTNAVLPCIPKQCSRVYQSSVPVYTNAVFPCIPKQCSRVYQCSVPVYTNAGNRKHPDYETMIEMVSYAMKSITPDVICTSCKVCDVAPYGPLDELNQRLRTVMVFTANDLISNDDEERIS